MKTFKIILVLCGLLLIPAMVTAQMQSLGVPVGTKIPHDLALKNETGERQSFEILLGENGLVLVFVRSADWCPYCQAQLIELGENAAPIKDLGYNIATVSYDSTDILADFKKKYDLEFTLLSDPRSRAIKGFEILNKDIQEGSKFYGVPHPAIFIIGYDGTIKAKLFEKDYQNRPPAEEIVKAIEELAH